MAEAAAALRTVPEIPPEGYGVDPETGRETLNVTITPATDSRRQELLDRTRRLALVERARSLKDRDDADRSAIDAVLGVGTAFGVGANEGMANLIGLPADAYSFLLEKIGLPNQYVRLAGSDSVKAGLGALGVRTDVPDDAPIEQRIAGRIGQEVGAAAGPIGAVATLARTAAQGGRFLGPMLTVAREAPAGTLAAETGLAALSGSGAAAGLEVTRGGSPAARMSGEILGQLAAGFGPYGLIKGGRKAFEIAERALEPFTEEGARQAASKVVKGAAVDAGKAAAGLDSPPPVDGQFTTGQRSQDFGLLTLERAVARTSNDIESRYQDFRGVQNAELRARLREATSTDTAGRVVTEFLEGRIDTLKTLLNDRLGNAVSLAKQRIDNLAPDIRAEEGSRIAREELEAALDVARIQEREIWARVDPGRGTPDQILVSTSALKQKAQEIAARRYKASRPEDTPDVLSVIEKYDPAESVDEMISGLRSRILRDIRVERSQPVPNRRKIAALEELEAEALAALDRVTGQIKDPDVKARAQAALAYSFELNEKFTRGPVGEAMGHTRSGAPKTPDIGTLEKLFQPGVPGEVGARALINAAGGGDRVVFAARNFLLDKFYEMATDAAGKVIPSASRRFLERFEGVLNQFPDVRARLENATEAQRVADLLGQQTKRRIDGVQDVRRSRAALFIDQEPEKAIARVLGSKKPVETMRGLVRQARQDPTGEALNGLKTLFSDEMFKRIETKRELDGALELSAASFRDFLKKHGKVMAEVYSPEEMRRAVAVGRALKMVEAANKASTRGGMDAIRGNINQNLLLTAVGRIVGARVGSRLGTTPLISAGLGAKLADSIIGKTQEDRIIGLLKEAIFDRELMKTLLTMPTRENAVAINKRYRAHLVNLGGETRSQPERQAPAEAGGAARYFQ